MGTVSELLSWGRYPRFPQQPTTPAWREGVDDSLAALRQRHGHTLAFGNGRSYGDSCLAASHHVVHMRELDRFIHVDWANGRIRAEAGVTIGELIAVALPRGWFPPVTPGTQFATLGGAVANDVHGKNHHVRGTLGRHVRALGIHRSEDGYRELRPTDSAPELFQATIGGLGLTGIIVWVELQLQRVTSPAIKAKTYRFRTLEEFLTLSEEYDPAHEYSVAWVDCLAPRRSRGRGLLTVGDHSATGASIIGSTPRSRMTVPMDAPAWLLNAWSVRAFNALTYHRPRRLARAVDVPWHSFFYPLDRLRDWNRLYGRRGFQQFQCVVPTEAAAHVLAEALARIHRSSTGSMLAVLKRCGDQPSPGLLSFPLPGISLALDFPQRGKTTNVLLSELDAIVHDAGGRLYPAKDAHMSPRDFRKAYPEWSRVESQRDPALLSQFWRRVIS